MSELDTARMWRSLTPGQRTMLRRLEREGPLHSPGPWEMRTVRSLLERGLVKSRPRGGTGPGLWFLSARGRRLLPRRSSDADVTGSRAVPSNPATTAAEMPR